MVLLISSITPVAVFLYLIYNKDHVKEPPMLLTKCFFGGILAIIFTLILVFPISLLEPFFPGDLLKSFYDAFLTAALPEEFSKFIILYWIIWKRKEFDHHYDGIIYAVFVSLGFALVENIMYVFSDEGGMQVALMRAVLAVPGHGFFAVIMGYYLSIARFHEGAEKNRLLLTSLLMAVLFHGIYDFILMYMDAKSNNPLLIILLIIIFSVFIIRLWRLGLKKIEKHHMTDHATIQQAMASAELSEMDEQVNHPPQT
jgi:RsiW-degrading membrane proteinase PrsW (M82 family)